MAKQSANAELADAIVKELIQKKLLQPKREAAVRTALVSGKTRFEDWKNWAEDFVMEESKSDDQDKTGKSDA